MYGEEDGRHCRLEAFYKVLQRNATWCFDLLFLMMAEIVISVPASHSPPIVSIIATVDNPAAHGHEVFLELTLAV